DGCSRLGHGRVFFGLFRVQTYLLTSQRAHVNFLVISPRDFPDASGPGYQRVPNLVPGKNFKTSITFATGVRFRPTNYQNEAIDDDYISSISDFASNNMKHYRPQPIKLFDARAFEWMDAVVRGMGGAFFGLFRVQTYSLTSYRAHVNFLVISPRDFPDASGPGYQRVPPLVRRQNFKTSITFATGVRFWHTNYQNEAVDDDYISSISDFASNNMKHYPSTTR